MEKLLYADLGGGTLAEDVESGGSNWSWPVLLQGDTLDLGFRLAEKINGEYVEAEREIASIRAKIGRLYARPGAGTFRIWIGDISVDPVEGVNLTAELPVDATATEVADALNALALVGAGGIYGAASVREAEGSWFVTFADEDEETPLRGHSLRFRPIGFLRVRASEQDGVWEHELRPDEAGLAFTDELRLELPDPPLVSHFIEGGDGVDAVQQVVFNPLFRGIYQIVWKGRVSRLLNEEDGPDGFGEALAKLADEDGEFLVTNPADNVGHIAFLGSMEGQEQPLLQIEVVEAPPGSPWITLDLSKKTAADLLRGLEADLDGQIELPFEIEIRYKDPSDEAKIRIWSWQQPVIVRRQLIWEGEATVNDTDYLRPVDPTSYRPFNASQIAVGNAHYPFELGDGVNAEHVVDHNLHTLLVEVFLRENEPGGRFLVAGTDFEVGYDPEGDGEDSVKITLLGDYAANPPEDGGLIGCVVALGHTAAFQAGVTWEQGQIVGFLEWKATVEERLAYLEGLGPGKLAATPPESAPDTEKPLPHFAFVYPQLGRSAVAPPAAGASLSSIDPATLPRVAPQLYPAVHDASVSPLPTVLDGGIRVPVEPTPGHVGEVYENQTADPVDIAIGSGWTLEPGGFAATDGETWYPVERYAAGESSYYPAHLARTLFEDTVQPGELWPGATMEIRVPLEIAVLGGNTPVHCQVVIETAQLTADTAPGTPGPNLATRIWSAPHLAQDLIVPAVPRAYVFGYKVRRSKEGVLTADKLVYGKWVATTPPAAATFQIRARLIRIDTPNTIAAPVGLIAVAGGVPFEGLPPDKGGATGLLTIRS
ncbi:MAG TPA: hypothetical protein PLA50_04800 [Bacteroidia bacterium]|nr:hypothetical protein [Bacteroidia bacterium]